MAKTLSYINTSPRTEQEKAVLSHGNAYRPNSRVQSVGLTMSEVIGKILPIISENYADAITQLMSASYLFNPAFANDAEGWIMSDEDVTNGRTLIVSSDNKNRLFLSDTGSILQSNDRIRKPGKHKEYTYTEKEEEGEEGNGTNPPEQEDGENVFEPSEELVTTPVEWEGIEEPEKVEGDEEKDDVLYLTFNYICRKSGTVNVGFVGTEESGEGSLLLQSVQMEESADIQTVAAEGTWDGKGNFKIFLEGGEVEVVSLSLLDKPLEEYRKQTDSYIKQTIENIGKAFEFIHEVIKRITLIQNHINQLYSNDSILNETIEGLKERVEDAEKDIDDLQNTDLFFYEQIDGILTTLTDHDARITSAASTASSAYSRANDAYYEALMNSIEISTINSTLTAIQDQLSSIEGSIDSLGSRVSALENASSST